MKSYAAFTALLLVVTIGIIISSCTKDSDDANNQPPVIHKLTTTPFNSATSPIAAGDQITISVQATDSDNTELFYLWEASYGEFVGELNRASIHWKSPMSSTDETYSITAVVSDGNTLVTESVLVYTQTEEEMSAIHAVPDTLNFGISETEKQIKVFAITAGAFNWEIADVEISWLTIDPLSGSLNNQNDTAYLSLTVSRTGLNGGQYSESFQIRNADDTENSIEVEIEMQVAETNHVGGYTFFAHTHIPIPGAVVSIGDLDAWTDDSGYYTFPDISPGTYELKAAKDGFDDYSLEVDIEPGMNEFIINMTSPLYTHKLSGVITNQSLSPIYNAEVVYLNPDGSASNLVAASDSTGYYEIFNVPMGLRTINYHKEGYTSIDTTVYLPDTDFIINAVLKEIVVHK